MSLFVSGFVAALALMTVQSSSSKAPAPEAATAMSSTHAASSAYATPVVIELFTSQSCSSCPPAEAYLRQLADNPEIIALEWHVDYWDELHHGRSGKWKDPFSQPEFTARQQGYNVALRGRGSVYTPQAVINGANETIGSHRNKINALIKKQKPIAPVIAESTGDTISFKVRPQWQGETPPLEAMIVFFKKTATTNVGGGENHGKELRETHIVTDFQYVTPLSPDNFHYQAKHPEEGYGCAFLLQEADGGPIRAAHYCPAE